MKISQLITLCYNKFPIKNNNIFFYWIFYYQEKCRCNILIYNGILFYSVGVRRLNILKSQVLIFHEAGS